MDAAITRTERTTPLPFDVERVLPARDFLHYIGAQFGPIAPYFEPTPDHAAVLAERQSLARQHPGRHLAALPAAAGLVDELLSLAAEHQLLPEGSLQAVREFTSPLDRLGRLAGLWEPDILLMRHTESGPPQLVGGVVCYPSNWRFESKVGALLNEIHAVVPELNTELAPKIDTLLRALKPGQALRRVNWGLSAAHDRNNHPDLGIPRLAATTPLDSITFRIEQQAAFALPRSGGFVFGIRVDRCWLKTLRQHPVAVAGLRRALETMTPEMARYKGLDAVRPALLAAL